STCRRCCLSRRGRNGDGSDRISAPMRHSGEAEAPSPRVYGARSRGHAMDLTIRDAVAIFDVSESRIYRWIHDDDLPAREVNGQLYFNRTELLEWATIHRVKFAADLFRDPSGGPPAGEGLTDALQLGGIVTGLPGANKDEILRTVVEKLRLPDDF